MKKSNRLSFVAVLALFLVVKSVQAQIVLDGDFALTVLWPGQQVKPAAGEGPWTYHGASYVVFPPVTNVYPGDSPDLGTAVYLLASSGNYGRIEQDVVIPARGTYRLTYQKAGRMLVSSFVGGDTTYVISLGATALSTNTTVSNMTWQEEEVFFEADPGMYTLAFALAPYPTTAFNQLALFDLIAIEPFNQTMTIETSPEAGHVPIGGRAVFSVTVSGVPLNEVVYQWLFDGAEMPGAVGSTLTIDNAQANHQGMYSVRVTHTPSAQTITTAPVSLEVSEFALESAIAIEVRFPSEVGKSYQLQSSNDLSNWTNLGDPIPGTGALIVECVGMSGAVQKYLRVREL